MLERTNKKKRNPIVAYFKPFGLRQICDLIMVAGAITVFIGIFVSVNTQSNWVVVAGMCAYALGCLMALIRTFSVIFQKDVNKRDPEYRTAVVNACIMGVVLLLTVFGIIAALFNIGAIPYK